MIPPNWDNCTEVPAGPVRVVVEARQVTEDEGKALGEYIEDYGPSLHIFGTESGSEYLRFDCFDRVPHYHYIVNDFGGEFRTGEQSRAAGNSSYKFDRVALGDPVKSTLETVRTRLPEMLEFVKQPALAQKVRQTHDVLSVALDSADSILAEAAEKAEKRFLGTVAAARPGSS